MTGDDQCNVVVLDRVREGFTPPYCVHGKATCLHCARWVYLGSETVKPVSAGAVKPLCIECAILIFPQGMRPVGRIVDHLRTDGPH